MYQPINVPKDNTKKCILGICFSSIILFSHSCSSLTTYDSQNNNVLRDGPAIVFNTNGKVFMGSVNLVYPQGLNAEAYSKIRKEYYNVERFINNASKSEKIVNAASWQEAHLYAKPYIESMRNEIVGFEVAQTIASSVLRSFFYNLDATPEVLDAIEYYMDVLLQYNYYREPNLFAMMLSKLQNRWPESRIKDVAKKTVYENTHFFKDPFSAERQFQRQAQKQLASKEFKEATASTNNEQQTFMASSLRLPLTSEEQNLANQLKSSFKLNTPQILKTQYSKLKPRDWGEWVFGYIEAVTILDMMAR